MSERRKYARYPVIHEMDQPIQISVGREIIPGVLVDLSAGGTALLTYTNIPLGTTLNLSIALPGLKTKDLSGSIVWVIAKGDMWRVGIAFTHIDPIDFRHINRMAFDFNDCEAKLALGVTDVCSAKCSYLPLCQKPVKLAK
ncbi:MAG: PilZ domain-containing protein [Endomicrobiales bacterium]|nr:PilZ domain-containing protein [Endomicrobiales bacterium]